METAMPNKKKKISTRQMTIIALMTAVTCILGPLSILLPFSPVPISFTNLAIYFSVFVLGTYSATVSYLVYLLIGMVGLPVFSGFSGGFGKLAGPTGGYLVGFIFMALIAGFFVDRFQGNRVMQAVGMILGTVVAYIFGTAWLCVQANLSFGAGLAAGVIPYVPGDLIKIAAALVVGPVLRKAVRRAA